MNGYLCLFALSFFLVKSFYKTCVFIMIWSLVLMNFNVGNDYTVWGLTSYVPLLVFFTKYEYEKLIYAHTSQFQHKVAFLW